jgi:hypothetical protein
MQAILFRAHELHILSDWTYQRAHIELSRRGEKKLERGEWPLVQPALISETLRKLEHELDITLDDVAASLGVSSRRIRSLMWTQQRDE